MVADNGKFRMSADFADYLKQSPIPAAGKKLLLVLIHLQHLEEEEWPRAVIDEAGHCRFEGAGLRGHFHAARTFRSFGLAPKSNDARFLCKAIEDLRARPELFDDLAYHGGPQGIVRWRFSSIAAAMMSDMSRYALIDVADIANCASDVDVTLLVQIALHQRMNRPELSLLRPDARSRFVFWTGETEVCHARQTIPKLKRSLAKWSRLKGYTFAIAQEHDGAEPGITDIKIRIRHEETRWPAGQFEKFGLRSRVVVVART